MVLSFRFQVSGLGFQVHAHPSTLIAPSPASRSLLRSAINVPDLSVCFRRSTRNDEAFGWGALAGHDVVIARSEVRHSEERSNPPNSTRHCEERSNPLNSLSSLRGTKQSPKFAIVIARNEAISRIRYAQRSTLIPHPSSLTPHRSTQIRSKFPLSNCALNCNPRLSIFTIALLPKTSSTMPS